MRWEEALDDVTLPGKDKDLGGGSFWKDMTWKTKERWREEISLSQMKLLRQVYRDKVTAPRFVTSLGH